MSSATNLFHCFIFSNFVMDTARIIYPPLLKDVLYSVCDTNRNEISNIQQMMHEVYRTYTLVPLFSLVYSMKQPSNLTNENNRTKSAYSPLLTSVTLNNLLT